MFNSIVADLPCSTNGQTTSSEIQIKWQIPSARSGAVYHLGDAIEEILPEYDNAWVRTDFVCEACSPRTKGRGSHPFIKVMDQQRHVVFVRVEQARIVEIIGEQDFLSRNIADFASDIL